MPLTAPVTPRSVAGVPARAGALFLAIVVAVLTLTVPAAPARADATRGKQWQLGFLRAQEAWRLSTGDGVTVAVIDSGVEASHPDLRGQVLPGADFVDGSTDGRRDVVGHGTTVAALIAGNGDADGVIGLAYRAKILPIRVLDAENKYDSADVVARAVRWAVDRGADVINLSLGSADVAPVLTDALQYAFDHDVVVVACDGNVSNNRGTTVWHPAREPGVIAVSGVIRSGKFWTGSLQGPATVVAAPAADITGAHPGGGYWNVQGTSFASPLVAAAAALVLARYPKLSSADVVNRLIQTAWDFGPKGRDGQFGFGIVNPTRALTADLPPVEQNPLLPAAPPAAGGQGEEVDPPNWPGEPTGQATPQAASAEDDDPWLPQSIFALLALACVGLIMVAVAGVVIVLLLPVRRGRRAAQPGYPYDPARYPAANPATPVVGYGAQPVSPPGGFAGTAPPDGFEGTAPPGGFAGTAPPGGYAPGSGAAGAGGYGALPPVAPPAPSGVPPVAPPAAPPGVGRVAPPAVPPAPAPAPEVGGPPESPVTPAAPTRRLGPWPPVWRRRPPR